MMRKDIVDLSECKINSRNGGYGGSSCFKEGIDYDGCKWLIKYPHHPKNSGSCICEYIGSHIYEILGFDVQDTVLGFRNNHIVVACRDFCIDGATLLEFSTVKNVYERHLQDMVKL